jgi:hypothetical protein
MATLLKQKNAITVPRKAVEKNGGVVVLSLKEYRRLCERAIPEYYLTGKAARDLDKLVREGLREYERGETILASSLDEALAIYERKQKNKKS